jgi:squalene-hopene/tetraprenyl-beta-curcumene cyclase
MQNLDPLSSDLQPENPAFESEGRLESVIDAASDQLMAMLATDGHWSFALEADVTIPSEYILLNHFLGKPDDAMEAKIAKYIRRTQGVHGGWPLYFGGEPNVSATVKAYFALKLAGDDIDTPHMVRARQTILDHGGFQECNVFTRFTLAMFGVISWRAVPVSRVEILLAPKWFPIHVDKVSYWTRTVTVPLLILTALRAEAVNPRNIGLAELDANSSNGTKYRQKNPTGHWMGSLLIALDKIARPMEPLIPNRMTQKAIDRALSFMEERSNQEDGLGGIFPAMANALMVYHALGVSPDEPKVETARKAIDRLLIVSDEEAYCQPCLSPVWDTGLAAHAMMETVNGKAQAELAKTGDWLLERQVLDIKGDWAGKRPDLRPGGWAFQYRNDHYPDVDDTAVVVMAMDRMNRKEYEPALSRAAEWVLGMQSNNGGWAAFDADNTYYFLEHIPFADHGALLDPPTSDVTARCISMLAQLGYDRSHPAMDRGLNFLKSAQEPDGSWYGRWGTNYIYGTWSVLSALNAVGEDKDGDRVRLAADWLEAKQNYDGGWGEDCATYWDGGGGDFEHSLPSQTAWAILGLMAAGRVDSEAVERGVKFLTNSFDDENGWAEDHYNAVGFPRVFYLKYHGYRWYFPLLALARYKDMQSRKDLRVGYGI